MQIAKRKLQIGMFGAAILVLAIAAPLIAQQRSGGAGGEAKASSDVSLNIPGVTADDANAERLLKVIVTGVGLDPPQAKANALAKAVEQAVGLMVDAETLVQNDEVLRDNVLTLTRGDVKNNVVLKEWQEDDLYQCQIQAEVVASKIAERLRKYSIELRPVPGDLFYHTAKERRRNLQNAAEMLRRQISGFSPAAYFKLEPAGEPAVVEQNDSEATFKATFRLEADLLKYMQFRKDLQELLRHMSDTRILATCLDSSSPDTPFRALVFSPEKANHMYYRVQKDGADFAYWVFMNQTFVPSAEPNTMRSQWEGYRVEKSLYEAFRELGRKPYKIHLALVDGADDAVAETDVRFQEANYDLTAAWSENNPSWRREMTLLGPFVWKESSYADQTPLEFTITTPVANVEKVKAAKAEIVEGRAP